VSPSFKKSLVIVESPAKARTVGRFLGDSYTVKASMGHVRDLPEHEMGVDVEKDFKPEYHVVKGRGNVVEEIKRAAEGVESVYLATDPDREGEAISWHLVQAAHLDRNSKDLRRVVFHEITKPAIDEAFSHPRGIDMRLVNAQQARRVLDRIVGYELSPVLWSKVRRGLSAGRVQSVALRLIVEREREIEAFRPEEYWVVSVELEKKNGAVPGSAEEVSPPARVRRFKATLQEIAGEKGRASVPNGERATAIKADLDAASYAVEDVRQKEVHQRPQPPFTTSTLQQEAARSLRMNAQRTMRIAQELYEGVQLGSGDPVGLITYMRTDSTNLAESALHEAHEFIKLRWGPQYAHRPRTYKTKSASAQEAHEAIRPTSVMRAPEEVARFLSPDQRRLYELIWRRMVASQMPDTVLDQTTADIAATAPLNRRYTLRATGSVIRFPGFRLLYIESREQDEKDEEEESRELPPLSRGEPLNLGRVNTEQKFTQPPPRYSEAMLIRALEEKGIGRPSTYATIVGTIAERDYVAREKNRFKPTKLGIAVCDLLTANFPEVLDPGFTAEMESRLDSIAEGKAEWVPVLKEFFGPFQSKLAAARQAPRVPREALVEETSETCEKCERPMVIRTGRFGKFLSCSGFPECRNARPIQVPTGIVCPKCGEGELVERKNRRGNTFWGCNSYPKCDFLVGQRPQKEPCPECGSLVIAAGRNRVRCTKCGYSASRSQQGEGAADDVSADRDNPQAAVGPGRAEA
jgi:DNA topoisomerase-1